MSSTLTESPENVNAPDRTEDDPFAPWPNLTPIQKVHSHLCWQQERLEEMREYNARVLKLIEPEVWEPLDVDAELALEAEHGRPE